MFGSNNDGIFHRAARLIMDLGAVQQNKHCTVTLTAGVVEIYNDTLRDLYNPKKEVKIQDIESKTILTGMSMTTIDVNNKSAGIKQVESMLSSTSKNRTVANTKMNTRSTRGHVVFIFQLCVAHDQSNSVLKGELKLFDLAGTERLDTGPNPSKTQRDEAAAINNSLTNLKLALTEGKKFKSFRSYKLTRLVKDCVCQNGKAYVIIHLSPAMESKKQTLDSLKFGKSIRNTKLGKAATNIQIG